MTFIVAFYLPWCRYLEAQELEMPRFHAENRKCVSSDPEVLLHVARFSTGCVDWLTRAFPKQVRMMSTSRLVEKDICDIGSFLRMGDKWSVKFEVRDLGGHLPHFAAGVGLVMKRLLLVAVLPLNFQVGFGGSHDVHPWCTSR